nr:hypothetical protein [Burkholderia sp. Leaf177]
MLVAESIPAATFESLVPAVPPSLMVFLFALSYATKALVIVPPASVVMPSAFNCAMFTASVNDVPAFTFTIWLSAPAEPTETVLTRSATAKLPSATALLALAVAFVPSAIE